MNNNQIHGEESFLTS